MDLGTAVSSEVTRIIECPYPASLAGLADLLARADISTIRACIHNRSPCSVSKLAALVCEALPLWAYTLRVLHYLSHSSEFRHELLLRNPGLLNALLTKALSSQRDFDDYVELCVLILSRPLPESITLPVAGHSFFLRVFEKATQSPDVDTLKSIYGMLNGACRQVLKLLPLDARQQFDRELCRILCSNNTGQNSMLLLWCFGIVLLVEHPEGIEDMSCPRSGPEQSTTIDFAKRQWKTSSCQKLFGSTKGSYKTISLICMSVVWAIKGHVGVSDVEAIEGIRIASRTLRFVDRNVRESWRRSQPYAEATFQKLSEKIKRTAMSRAVLLEALCFFAMIADLEDLQSETVTQYEQTLKEVTQFADSDRLSETLEILLPAFAPQMQEDTIRSLLVNVLDACSSAPSPHQLSNLVVLVDELNAGISTSEPLLGKMLRALSANTTEGKLWSFIQTVLTNEDASCRTYAVTLHQKLISATIALLLTTALVAHTEEPALPNALVVALIKKQQQRLCIAHQCSHYADTGGDHSVSLFQQECTPYTGQHLQDWRHRLTSELESQSFYQRDSIIRSIAQICQDLETRCNTVEEPLRRERERSKELEQRVASLNEQISSLESQAADDRFHLDGLEDEKLNIADEKDRVTAELEELKVKFIEARKEADQTLRLAKDNFAAQKLELESTILQHEEDLCARHQVLEELSATVSRLEEAQEQQEKEHRKLDEQHEHLRGSLTDTEQKLVDERENTSRQAEEVTRLENRGLDLENQLQSTKVELEITTRRLNDLRISHQELVNSSEAKVRELKIEYYNSTEAAAIKAEEERKELNAQLQSVSQNNRRIKDAYDETRQEVQLLRTSIPPLEAKVQELTAFCSEQEEELEELRTLRKNVLASMGLAAQNPLAIRSASRSYTDANDSLAPRPPREHRRRKSAILTQDVAPKATINTQGITSTTMENLANASFASSDSHSSQGGGSTRKRPKPRPSFKVPAMHTPYTQKPVLISKSVSKKLSPSKRLALGQMSPNRRHTTVGFAEPEIEDEHDSTEAKMIRTRRGSLQGIERADFDMDDFLAGTPLTPGNFMAGTGRVPEEDDDTTTEL